MSGGRCCFTVFTPTYNRQHTLDGVYDSLRAQTFRDFEWLIVDDGSTDGTGELVRTWQAQAGFPIRYFYQENRGKHVAFNRGIKEANGELFLVFDSDDGCVPQALERFKYHWDSIPFSERDEFSTITALCSGENGNLLGSSFPSPVIDAVSAWEQMKYRGSADRWGVNRTEVLRRFPYPEIPGEKFIAEGLVWTRMSVFYKARFINERLKIVRYRPNGLSASSLRLRAANPRGARLCYQESLRTPLTLSWKLRDTVNYVRFSFHAGVRKTRIIAESADRALTAALLPVGFAAYRRDRHALAAQPACGSLREDTCAS